MLAVLCPSQGSQRPGMLTDWLTLADQCGFAARPLLSQWSAASDLDLIELGCHSDADTIRDTAHAQPLIVALSLLSYRIAQTSYDWQINLVAGHSVGELTALSVAGVIRDDQAVTLAAIRGRAMAQAAAQADTTMAAIIGGNRAEVLAALATHDVIAANFNAASQLVAAGARKNLTALAAELPSGARLLPIAVAGAFHTDYMASAVPPVQDFLATLTPSDPSFPLVSNRDGQLVTSGTEALARVASQITSAVQWERCQDTIRTAGISHLVELAPAGVLAGLARRELTTLNRLALAPTNLPELANFSESEA